MESSLVVPVGSDRVPEIWTLVQGFRTAAQFERVQAIVKSGDFAFSCSCKLFDPEGCGPYRGPVSLVWYDKAGRVRVTRIGARGNVLVQAQA